MSDREYEDLRNALASASMEGFEITEQTEMDCICLMGKEVSVANTVEEILSRPTERSDMRSCEDGEDNVQI